MYEDEGFARLSPLADARPVFDLRVGRFTLLEKLRRWYPGEEFHLWVRDELAGLAAEAHPDCRVNRPTKTGRLFLSGRAILRQRVSPKGHEAVLVCRDEVVGFRVCANCSEKLGSVAGLAAKLEEEQVEAEVVKWPWDAVELNAQELVKECAGIARRKAPLPAGVTLIGPRSGLTVAPGARLWPGTVISTETGPVMIDRSAQVRPGSFVEGPCYVGPETVIDGARVRPGCSFGPACRVGGEVESSIFQGHANKHHDGFLGHSFVGEWVNLGALTTNSDLKNAYEPVRVFFDGKPHQTGLLKVGCFIGDHVKTAIGTLLNTGTRVGFFANWFEPGLSPREIAPFARGRDGRWNLPDAVGCAREVMRRRGKTMSAEYESHLRRIYAAARGRAGK